MQSEHVKNTTFMGVVLKNMRIWTDSDVYLLIHVALVIFPGFRRLVDLSLTVNAVIHQDVASEKYPPKSETLL